MSIDSIVRSCNKQAMEYLCSNNYDDCFRLLKKAEEIINSPNYPIASKLHAVTFNNLGCYYKRINSFDLALSYLQKALTEENDTDQDVAAGTHLNILTVYSQKNNHEQALYHGIQALKLLQDTKQIETLVIALQSTGDQYVAIGNIEKAITTYKYAFELSQKHFGDSHEYTTALYEKYTSITEPEKKFYFEKINQRASKQTFKKFKNFSILPNIKGPIRPSKSFEKSPIKQKTYRNINNNRVYLSRASNKPSVYSTSREKSKSNQRHKHSIDDTYMKLEEKINHIQNQLENFEERYSNLENFAKQNIGSKKMKKVKKTPQECAIMIQKV